MHLLISMYLIYAFNSPHLGEYLYLNKAWMLSKCVCVHSQHEYETENSSHDHKDVIRVS